MNAYDWAMASIAFLVCLPDVIYQHAGRTWSLFCSTVDDLPVNPKPFFMENSWPVDGLSTKHADFFMANFIYFLLKHVYYDYIIVSTNHEYIISIIGHYTVHVYLLQMVVTSSMSCH